MNNDSMLISNRCTIDNFIDGKMMRNTQGSQ